MTNEMLVPLGDLWPRRGFVRMPPEIEGAVFQALNMIPPPDHPLLGPPVDPGRVSATFLKKCEEWVVGSKLERSRFQVVSEPMRDGLTLTTCHWPDLFTIGKVLVDPKNLSVEDFERPQWGSRWAFYPYAFTVYWALFYHLPTPYLERPEIIWETILRHLELLMLSEKPGFATEKAHQGLDRMSVQLGGVAFVEQRKREFFFALYERTLGMHFDRDQRLGHYEANISKRVELNKQGRKRRVEAFDFAITTLLERIANTLFRARQ